MSLKLRRTSYFCLSSVILSTFFLKFELSHLLISCPTFLYFTLKFGIACILLFGVHSSQIFSQFRTSPHNYLISSPTTIFFFPYLYCSVILISFSSSRYLFSCNGQCLLLCVLFLGNEITMDLRRLEEMVQDPTHLDDFITIIDQRLQAKNNRAQLNTSTQQVGSSSKFDACINFGKDLVMKMSKRVERNRCMVCCKSAYNRDTRKVVGEVFKGATQIQLLAAGVCVVGYLLDQIEQVSNNMEHCIRLLRLLCALARRVKQVDHDFPAERQSLDEAVDFIFHGCVLCLTQMESHRLFRIFQASADAEDLQTPESQIRNTYADLTIGAVIGVLDNIPRFLPTSQGQGPQPVGREVAKDRLVKLLKVDPTNVSKIAVVVYGFDGIGKTTLASAVLKTLPLQAYKACRIDMDANCTSNDIKQLQQQMLSELFGQGNVQLNSCQQGWDQLTDAFREEDGRIFLFIDNALEAENLQKLLPTDLSCLPSGIRILVTTRNSYQTEMLSGTGLDYFPYEVDVLSFSDSKKLFCEKKLLAVPTHHYSQA